VPLDRSLHLFDAGRLFNGKGKTKESKMYKGGCVFIDSASGYVHIELQAVLGSTETLKAKEAFELMCQDAGVFPKEYLMDNSSGLPPRPYVLKLDQRTIFSGIGAHHHNGIAERTIQTIMAITHSMMLHLAIHWPAVANPQLWLITV
jgi:hypothetical protein